MRLGGVLGGIADLKTTSIRCGVLDNLAGPKTTSMCIILTDLSERCSRVLSMKNELQISSTNQLVGT